MIETFIEVKIKEDQDFLKIKETLTRIGIASKKSNTLTQSCHILHKKGSFYIVHFKELFALDGRQSDFSEEDKARRNTIASLLEEWGLLSIVNSEIIKEPRAPLSHVKIIPFKDKDKWELVSKYTIGKRKKD